MFLQTIHVFLVGNLFCHFAYYRFSRYIGFEIKSATFYSYESKFVILTHMRVSLLQKMASKFYPTYCTMGYLMYFLISLF